MEENIVGNKFIVVDENDRMLENVTIDGLDVDFRGLCSIVVVHLPIKFMNCRIFAHNNSYVEIFPSKYEIMDLTITAKNKSEVIIQEDFSCIRALIENHDEPNLKINIGKDVMFSHGIYLKTSDGHAILSTEDNKVLNRPQKGISIGDHVWVGVNTTILKDVTIPNNTIIGAGSTITKSFDEENTIIAGTPAQVIKRGVTWDRRHTGYFDETASV